MTKASVPRGAGGAAVNNRRLDVRDHNRMVGVLLAASDHLYT
jgi:hypothetical protein